MPISLRLIPVIACLWGLWGGALVAQDREEGEASEGDLPLYTVEEIVVTGNREKIPDISTVATAARPFPVRRTAIVSAASVMRSNYPRFAQRRAGRSVQRLGSGQYDASQHQVRLMANRNG